MANINKYKIKMECMDECDNVRLFFSCSVPGIIQNLANDLTNNFFKSTGLKGKNILCSYSMNFCTGENILLLIFNKRVILKSDYAELVKLLGDWIEDEDYMTLLSKDFGKQPEIDISEKPTKTKPELHMELCKKLNDIYTKKNHDYGDSFHRTFEEEGFSMARIRLTDKLERFKTLTRNTDAKVTDESIRDTLMDMANYALMTVLEMDISYDPTKVFKNYVDGV